MLKALEIHTARNKVIVSVLSNLTAKFFDSSIQQFTIIRSSFRSRFSFKSFRAKLDSSLLVGLVDLDESVIFDIGASFSSCLISVFRAPKLYSHFDQLVHPDDLHGPLPVFHPQI